MYVVKDETLNVCITLPDYRAAQKAFGLISNNRHDVSLYKLTYKGLELFESDRHTSQISQDVGPTMGVMR